MATTIVHDAELSIFAIGDRSDPSGTDEPDLSSEEARLVTYLFDSGGYVGDIDAFRVQHDSGMDITIGSGNAKEDVYIISGDVSGQGKYIVRIDPTNIPLTVPAADPSSRVDEVYVFVSDSAYDTSSLRLPRIGYRRGESGQGTPGPDSAWRAYELLAEISVSGGASSVSGNITDRRVQASLQDSVGARLAPAGTIDMYGGSSAPSGWLLCNGQAVSRSTYNRLFEVIGTIWGSGNGSTTFNVPDFRNRFPVGVGSSYSLNASGGANTVALSISQMPSHTHTSGSLSTGNAGSHRHDARVRRGDASNHTHGQTGQVAAGQGQDNSATNTNAVDSNGTHSHGVSGTTASRGSGSAHENRPPYRAVNFIIKI